jgi:hypothetical protein
MRPGFNYKDKKACGASERETLFMKSDHTAGLKINEICAAARTISSLRIIRPLNFSYAEPRGD